MKKNTSFVYLVLSLVGVVMIISLIFRQQNQDQGCNVNPQSPWGQSQASVWTAFDRYEEARVIADFDFQYPKMDGSIEKYAVYTKELLQVTVLKDDTEQYRLMKAYTCGAKELYAPQKDYALIQKETISGINVRMYGDQERVNIANWSIGDYSYGLYSEKGLTKEELTDFVEQMK